MTRAQPHPGDRVRIRGERWRIARCLPYDAVAVLEVQGCGASNHGEHARFLLPFELLDRLALSSVPRVVRPAAWRRAARRALADASPSWTSLRAAARANLDLIPFQLEPALALARGEGCRFLIADGVGMGKTVQAGLMIAELLHCCADSRVLVVTPAGLRDQWRDELRTRFGLEAEVLDAAGIARTHARLPAGLNPWSVHSLAITSVDYVKRPEVLRCHEPLLWDLVIFDEAHGLAGRSDRAAAADALGRRARMLVMLTATPHSGDDEAFRRMCGIGRLKDDGPILLFRRTRRDAGFAAARRAVLLRIRPTAAEAAMHDALMEYGRLVWTQSAAVAGSGAPLAISVLLRRASSSAASLARSLQRRMALLSDPSSRAVQASLPFGGGFDDEEPGELLGAAGLRDARDERARLERLLALAHEAACAESKLAALRRLLSRSREPAIVFTEYRDTLQRVAEAMRTEDAVQLHGGLSARERTEALRRFASGDARLLLATDAASEGLNLHQRCRLVINLELPWTPLRLEQRAGRVDRIGQARRVHAVHLVASDTSEETVLATLARRMARMQRAMGALGQLPDERDVAACVLGERALPDPATPAPPLPLNDIKVVDLGLEGRSEAARIERCRALLDPRDDRAWDGRPVIARVRRAHPRTSHPRTSHPSVELFWLFRLLLADTNGRILWDAALPITAAGAPIRARSHTATRLLLDPSHPDIQHTTARAMEDYLQSAQLAARRRASLWLRREHALIEELRVRHARLSAGLLQFGLFDRRQERIAAAQASLIEAALSGSAARIADLTGSDSLHVDSCDLVFAVALDGGRTAPRAVGCQ